MALREFILESIKSNHAVYPYLNRDAQKLAAKQFQSYDALRSDFWARVYDTVLAYLEGNKPITLFRKSIINMMTDYYQEAAELGYQDNGAELPLDDKMQSQVDGIISGETANIKDLFVNLRDNSIPDYITEAMDRADGYSRTLDSLYGLGKVGAMGEKLLTLAGEDGNESCADCQAMKQQWHPASWWVENDMIPRPGNPNYACGNWPGHCNHHLEDKDGNEFVKYQ